MPEHHTEHQFDDLIVDTIEPKNPKTKSFLTVIALAIIVLIVAIILTKTTLKSPDSEILVEEESRSSEMISPELTLQSALKEEEIAKPLIPTIEEIKPEVKINTAVQEQAEPKEIKAKEPESKATIETPEPKTVEITNEFAEKKSQEERAKIAEAEALKKQNLAKESAAKAAKEREIATQKEAAKRAKEKAKKVAASEKVANPYFIQVGSFSKTPSERFLSVIKNSGFQYLITSPSGNGTKKLLIGPYATKVDADRALAKVKDRINKSAYIIRK